MARGKATIPPTSPEAPRASIGTSVLNERTRARRSESVQSTSNQPRGFKNRYLQAIALLGLTRQALDCWRYAALKHAACRFDELSSFLEFLKLLRFRERIRVIRREIIQRLFFSAAAFRNSVATSFKPIGLRKRS